MLGITVTASTNITKTYDGQYPITRASNVGGGSYRNVNEARIWSSMTPNNPNHSYYLHYRYAEYINPQDTNLKFSGFKASIFVAIVISTVALRVDATDPEIQEV